MSYLVSEDLRQYASAKEAGIRERIDAFRKQKEDELKRKIGRRIIENELKQLVLKRMREGRPEITKILDEQFEYLLTRLTTKWSPSEFEGRDTPDLDYESEATEVKAKFNKFVEDARYLSEVALKKKAELVRNLMAEASTPQSFGDILIENRNYVVDRVDELKKRIEHHAQDRAKLHAEVATAALAEVESAYKQKVSSMIHTIYGDVRQFHAMMADLVHTDMPHGDRETVHSFRRRLLLTIEKRIQDLTRNLEMEKRETMRKITQEYRLEVVKLFLRYVEVTAGRFGERNACRFSETPFLKAAWEQHNVPIRDRVKFIQLVFEKVRSPELFWYVHEALLQDSSFISQ